MRTRMLLSAFFGLVSIAALLPGIACASATVPAAAQPRQAVQTEVALEGYVEVLIEDSAGGSRTLYFLIADSGRIPLRFIVDPPNLTTGTRVRLRGRWDTDGTFVVSSLDVVQEG